MPSKLIGLGLVGVLAACAGNTPRPDLERLYGMQAGNPDQPPVVIVHGALGSRLDDSDGREHWPGSLRRIAFGDYRELRLDIDPATLQPQPSSLTPSGVATRAGGVDFYGRILETLESAGGYRRGVVGEPAARGEKRYYVFVYDWRHDNVVNARALHDFLGQVRADYNDDDLQVDVVAHSMGGMIVRYYARYGTVDVLNDNDFPVTRYGEQYIRRVVLLGTPSLGSVGALQTLMRGYKVGLGTIPPAVVATFPSTYQVLPHAITNWFVDVNGKPVKKDHFSSRRFWRAFGYAIFDRDVRADIAARFGSPDEATAYLALLERYFHKQLERARRFSWSLTVPVPDAALEYIVFGGDCEPTPARAVWEKATDGTSALRLRPNEIDQPNPAIDYDKLMFEPGDGTVTKASLLAKQSFDPTVARHKYSHFLIDYPVFLCERHSQLTGNLDFQNNLLHALLSIDR